MLFWKVRLFLILLKGALLNSRINFQSNALHCFNTNNKDIEMKIKLIALSTILAITTGCSSVTNEYVKIEPFEYNIPASKNDIYFAAVDCTLENISAPATNGQFFDYQDKESGRLSVAFNSEYVVGISAFPLKTTMSIKADENKLTIRFSNLQAYSKYAKRWGGIYQQADGSKSEAELKIDETASSVSSCIKERV